LLAKSQPTAASNQPADSTPEHPPFPIPGVPMTCPDEENGVCWCGGPNQQFPCEPCRLKRDANNLDLKAVAEPKLRVPQLRVPHSGARRRSARQGGIAKNLPSRSSEPCTLYPAPCTLFPGPCCRVCNDFEESHSNPDKNCHPQKTDSFKQKNKRQRPLAAPPYPRRTIRPLLRHRPQSHRRNRV
jgi:hypothetical protein